MSSSADGLLVRSTLPGQNLRQMPTCQRFTPQVQTAGQSNLPVYWFLSFFVGSFSFLICILQFWYVFFLRLGYRRPHLVFMDLLRCVAMKSNHLHLLDYSFFVLLPCGGAGWRTQGFAWCDGSQTSTRRPSALLMQTDRSTTDCSRSPICTGAI